MGRMFLISACLWLAACVSVPPGERLDDAELSVLVRDVAAQVDLFSYTFGLDGEPDFAGVQSALADVRFQAMGRMPFGLDGISLQRSAGLGALQVTISACEDAVSRLRYLYAEDRAAAMDQVRGRFRLSCVLPLSMLRA